MVGKGVPAVLSLSKGCSKTSGCGSTLSMAESALTAFGDGGKVGGGVASAFVGGIALRSMAGPEAGAEERRLGVVDERRLVSVDDLRRESAWACLVESVGGVTPASATFGWMTGRAALGANIFSRDEDNDSRSNKEFSSEIWLRSSIISLAIWVRICATNSGH